MKQVLIGVGSDCTQPFTIKDRSGVSRRHAMVTIDDDGVWWLKDLGSSNGTFIRDNNGELCQVSEVAINEMTFICLGPDNANGCCFYARQLFGAEDFTVEFEYLSEVEERFTLQEERTDALGSVIRYSIGLVSAVALIVSLLPLNLGGDWKLVLLRIGSFLTTLMSFVFDANKRKKRISKARNKFHHCPNPECTHTLSTNEIHQMQCSRCKAK